MVDFVGVREMANIPAQQVVDAVDAAHGNMDGVSTKRAGHQPVLDENLSNSDNGLVDVETLQIRDERERICPLTEGFVVEFASYFGGDDKLMKPSLC